jgi:hypothetical protein
MVIATFVALFACTISLAQAGTATSVGSVDGYHSNGINDGLFNTNENVYISWRASGGSALVDVYVTSLSSHEKVTLYKVTTALGSGGVDSGTDLYNQPTSNVKCIYFVPQDIGSYEITCVGKVTTSSKTIGVGTVVVTPESALGSIMVIGAGIAAFGTIGVVKKRHSKVKKA